MTVQAVFTAVERGCWRQAPPSPAPAVHICEIPVRGWVAEYPLPVALLAPAVDHVDVRRALVLTAIQRGSRIDNPKDGLLAALLVLALAAQQVHHSGLLVPLAPALARAAAEPVRAATDACQARSVGIRAQLPNQVHMVGGLVRRAGRAVARVGRAVARVPVAALVQAQHQRARAPQSKVEQEQRPEDTGVAHVWGHPLKQPRRRADIHLLRMHIWPRCRTDSQLPPTISSTTKR